MTDLSDVAFIVPTFNEEATIVSFLHSFQSIRTHGAELIVADGGSFDHTAELVRPHVDQLVCSNTGRACQMNAGANKTDRRFLCFVHADTTLPATVADDLLAFMSSGYCWGRFDVKLTGKKWMFVVIAGMINWRSRLSGIATGDQAMFMSRDAYVAVAGFPDIPLMEDVAMSKKLKKIGRPFCIGSPVTTSSRRWQHHGVWKTIFLMWKLRWLFYRGTPADKLHQLYYGSP